MFSVLGKLDLFQLSQAESYVLDISFGPYVNIWVGKAAMATDVSWYHLNVVSIAPLYSFEHAPSNNTRCKAA